MPVVTSDISSANRGSAILVHFSQFAMHVSRNHVFCMVLLPLSVSRLA